MGQVYRVEDVRGGRNLAIKYLPSTRCSDKTVARFGNELRTATRVKHPGVRAVYELIESDGRYFLVMEYIDGETLAKTIERDGRLPDAQARAIAGQLCDAVGAAHDAGVLHRDLKPANIMIDSRGRLRITDFGLATAADEIIATEIRAGTPSYMSPEQIAGLEVTVRSDIYALGLVLYELFTGQRAFKADSPEQVRRLHESATPVPPSVFIDGFDSATERIILRCLRKHPNDRPQSVREVAKGFLASPEN